MYYTRFLIIHAPPINHPIFCTWCCRWNFNGGGPEAGPPPLKAGEVGAVMSLPGSIDQTIHADTAHLWTHAQLPGHYYNLFLPGVQCPEVAGQTAFVLGTHHLKSCAKVMTQEGGQAELEEKLIRPHLQLGDALVFDCRILHFGLGNHSTDVWRPMLYINYHQQWFVDPKVCKGVVVGRICLYECMDVWFACICLF